MTAFKDELFTKACGTTFDKWSQNDIEKDEGIAKNCHKTIRNNQRSKQVKQNKQLAQIYYDSILYYNV